MWCGRRSRRCARELMEGEVSELIGAELGERRPDDRMTHRNGYRAREWQTRAGTVELQIPKLRRGSATSRAFWSRAGARSRRCWRSSSRRTCAASRRGASTSWSRASGCAISKSEVSRICQALDEHVEAFRTPAAGGRLPVSVPGRQGREGPRRRPRGQQGAGDRARRARDRPARDPLDRRRRGRDRGVLDRLPQRPGRARPGRRPARDQRRARRAEGRDREGPGLQPGSAAPCTSCATASATRAAISTGCWRR